MYSKSFFAVLLCCLLQKGLSRYISLSVNLSMALNSNDQPTVTPDLLRSCMKEAESSMVQLSQLRAAYMSSDTETANSGEQTDLHTEDYPDNQYNSVVDYESNAPVLLSEQNEETLQCFVHCLYERMGLTKDGILIERDLMHKLNVALEREKGQVKECMNLSSNNKCEAAYKVHLCYSKLKTLEAERRIREILEYGDNMNGDGTGNNEESDDGGTEATDDINGIAKNEINSSELSDTDKMNNIDSN